MEYINNLLIELSKKDNLITNFKHIENNFNEFKINKKLNNLTTDIYFLVDHFNYFYSKQIKTNDDIIKIQILSYRIAKYLESKSFYHTAYGYYLKGIEFYYPKSFLALALYFQCLDNYSMTLKLLNMFDFLIDKIKESENYYNELIDLRKETISLIKKIDRNNMIKYSKILISL